MAIKVADGYACSYCGKVYPRDSWADSCADKHDLIYVQISREDLNRLIQFLFTGEPNLITPNLYRRLRRYAKLKTSPDEDTILSGVPASDSNRSR